MGWCFFSPFDLSPVLPGGGSLLVPHSLPGLLLFLSFLTKKMADECLKITILLGSWMPGSFIDQDAGR